MGKTRRLQLLLEPEQFARLQSIANRTGASYAAVVRSALDRYLPLDVIGPGQAAELLLDAPLLELGNWMLVKKVIREPRSVSG